MECDKVELDDAIGGDERHRDRLRRHLRRVAALLATPAEKRRLLDYWLAD